MKKDWLYKVRHRIRIERKVQAPEGLLDDIKKEMTRRGVAPVHSTSNRSKTIPMWVYRSAAAAALLAVGLYITDLLINPVSKDQMTVAEKRNKVNIVATPAITASNDSKKSCAQDAVHSMAQLFETALKSSQHSSQGNTLLADNENPDKITHITNSNPTETTDNPTAENSTAEKTPSTTRPPKGQTEISQSQDNYTLAKLQEEPSKFSFGTSYSGLGGTSGSAQGVLLTYADPYGDFEDGFSGNSHHTDFINSEERRTKTKHHQPIKFGVSVRYNINERWSVQTGLTYSHLSSDFAYSSGNTSRSVKQRLHYVGLPVSANYSLYKKKRTNLYVRAGGEVEKLVKGETTQHIENAVSPNVNSTKVSEKSPVFSVNAAIGGEFRLSKDISVYAEPGVSHHFNNGSNIENIYKEKPTSLNLSVGIRVNLNK